MGAVLEHMGQNSWTRYGVGMYNPDRYVPRRFDGRGVVGWKHIRFNVGRRNVNTGKHVRRKHVYGERDHPYRGDKFGRHLRRQLVPGHECGNV